MKRPFASLHLVLPVTVLLLYGLPAKAVTFTNDTAISFNNTNYDGMAIVVTNCTLIVDGLHSFASLQVLNGGNLTHSFAPNGLLENLYTVTNEPQVLSVTNTATLSNAYVLISSIVVQDFTGLVTYTNNVDYVISPDTNGMTTLLLTTSSAIAEGSTNLVSYEYLETVAAGLSLTVTGDVTVAQGGTINADGKGYGGASGPGAGNSFGSPLSGSGAGHGGYGGQSAALNGFGFPYDSIQQPVSLGSGGGSGLGGVGGGGGGSIKLVVAGNLRVDGTVSANGANGINDRSGGGSGGSIWLTCQNLSGAGVLSVNGGAGEPSQGGGGAGGRISLQFAANTFSGLTPAYGGNGYTYGGAGTIYTRLNSQSAGQVLVDNGGKPGTSTVSSGSEAFDLTVQGGATISLSGSQAFGNLLVASNAWISLSMLSGSVTVTSNATVQAGGGIIADGAGYAGGQGTGAGRADSSAETGGGGGYGGYGAAGGGTMAYGGSPYGAATEPVTFGSGGGSYSAHGLGGAGGGAIRLSVTGMLLLDGRISANGSPGLAEGSGGGSGGSVWVTAGTLTGGGTISANGGTGNGLGLTGGGGGGGGRIAIQYGTDLFFGVTSACGGGGSAWGGAGTIYTALYNQSSGQVLVDNGGQSGTNTTWTWEGNTVDLTVQGGAVVSPPVGQTIGTLLVASNGWISVASQSQVLTVTGNATIQAGGGIIADSMGYPGGGGSGAGRYVATSSGYIGGGGGYGGYGAAGGAPSGYSAYGGSTYGSLTAPAVLGSGGGSYSTYAIGGAGGGAITFNVTGVLQVDGRISAAGGPGINPSAGGGSGGGISISAGTLAGAGTISANGGMGNYLGGGGGGGRIAIVCGAYDFSGVVSAYGGGGYAWGGAGTVYTKANSQSFGQVTVDNGGQSGTNTSWSPAGTTVNVMVRGGAFLSSSSSQTFGTLLVASNGWVNLGNQMLTVTSNATIQAGGGIIADGTGSPGGSGTGRGSTEPGAGGGGGHGGYGASGGAAGAFGGTTYGTVTAPTEVGSGGGGYSPAVGGAGGGAIYLSVSGTLEVNGSVSARGLAGTSPSAGGGSGGSIYLVVGGLAGSGVITANGGAGNGFGGGGGGGRIAVVYTGANTFSGLMSAYGGGGYAWGGAGTIYTTASGVLPVGINGLVVVDNGGQAGTNTTLGSVSLGTINLTVKNGAWLSLSGGQFSTLLIASNGWLSVVASPPGLVLTLNVTGNATIQAGGGIIADGAGYASGAGPGVGGVSSASGVYVGGGGGNGGYGAAGGGSPAAHGGYVLNSLTTPGAGSGGGYPTGTAPATGGAGGGALTLNVTGTLEVDGRISAAGGAGLGADAGGGAGGGINLTAGTLAGAGVIAANGGAGNGLGGGGGGGRIAITYTANAFSGLMSAYGGGGYAWGGAGTVYTKANNQSWGQVVVDNGGQAGTNTSWSSTGTIDLTVKGGAVVSPPSSQTMGDLLVASNAWISLSTQTLTVTSNATVQAGGGILADSNGYAADQGSGAGKYAYSSSYGYVGGGGGHGGLGAASGGSPAAYGGGTYGSVTAPLDVGSGGGSYSSSGPGGAGGGIVNMHVTGALLVDGRISANGGAGIGQGTGGGSGGSVWLTAGTLAGAGTIAANGGAGNELGGGGGGGCVSLQYGVNAFEGGMSAYGGGGYAWGGAGTVYTKANSQNMGQLVVDNGGQNGTNTPIAYLSPFDLTIKGGAVAYPSGSYLLLSNLLVTGGGGFTCLSTQTNLDVAVLRNATIDATGIISVDSKGFVIGFGPGAGLGGPTYGYVAGSGAGYGGNGGASTVAPGGGTYGSAQQPVDRGSGGGYGMGGAVGGSEGGGAIHFTVGGALTVNGRLSAAGDAALQDNSGGGSGGSIWLTAGALTGNGAIAADGGAGELYDGGGGGGRVAIYAPVNAFAGVVSAAGASGAFPGQNGSIYSAPFPPPPQVVSTTPAGALNAGVSSFNILFSTVVNPASVSAATVTLTAPGGVAVSNLAVSAVSPYLFSVSFPQQIAAGNYVITVGPQVLDLLGQPMSQVYTGGFSIVWSLVEGAVTDTNGLPVPGVVLQAAGEVVASTITDTNGLYLLSLPPAGTIQVTPSATNLMFVPSSRTYVNVTGAVSNENYLAVSTIAPVLAVQFQTNTCLLNWYGISGVTYQPLYSTNLDEGWLPYDGALAGTNGAMQLLIPADTAPMMFFRIGASD